MALDWRDAILPLTEDDQRRGTAPASLKSPLTPTIFHEAWWLDAATCGHHRKAEVESGGTTVGFLPYALSRELGQSVIGMPMLTHFLGPAIDDGTGGATTRLSRRLATAGDLIRQLPAAAHVWFKLHRGVTDTIAFKSAGYRTEVQFTSEIAPAPVGQLWSGLHHTARRLIRRAGERLAVTEIPDAGRFMDFYEANLRDRGWRNHYDRSVCLALIEGAVRRGIGRLLGIADDRHALEAAIFTVWDKETEYYLMSTRRRDADNGAVAALIWAAIRHAAESGLCFDLDGIRSPADVQFLTRFGGELKPRYVVSRSTTTFRSLRLLSGRSWQGGRLSTF